MDETIILTREDIGNAIVYWVGIFKRQQCFFPYHIKGTDTELHIPDSVMFHLGFVPMGSKKDDFPHNI